MDKRMNKSISNIFRINLSVRKNDRTIVFTDGLNRNLKRIGKAVYESGKTFTNNIRYIESRPTGCHGVEPPEDMWKEAFGQSAFDELRRKGLIKPIISKKITEKNLKAVEEIIGKNKKEAAKVIIALTHYSTSHTRFRDLLNRVCRARYASMPLFDKQMLTGAMQVNWKRMKERSEKITRIVNRYEDIEIRTPNGTFITLSKKGRKALKDTGFITKAGEFSNLPAGEVFLAPLEGTAEGTMVLEWAPTRKLKNPVILHIEKGMVRNVEGREKYAGFLRDKLSERRENRNIAELGIGTNNRASRPDNILESEKIFGTIHIALGDNSSFGGKVSTSFHQDFVFFKPTVTLISRNCRRRILLKNGKLSRKG
jgi:leucyl aminopeptidase (aminopeptidase T)